MTTIKPNKFASDFNDHKDVVFDILAKHKIEKFEVEFDGSGDSGQIENIDLDDDLLDTEVVSREEDTTLRSLIETVCYEALEHVCGGWEIDAGSYGTFNFDVPNRKVRLDFNERVEDVNYHEYNF